VEAPYGFITVDHLKTILSLLVIIVNTGGKLEAGKIILPALD
jgi:hypothetical protein